MSPSAHHLVKKLKTLTYLELLLKVNFNQAGGPRDLI